MRYWFKMIFFVFAILPCVCNAECGSFSLTDGQQKFLDQHPEIVHCVEESLASFWELPKTYNARNEHGKRILQKGLMGIVDGRPKTNVVRKIVGYREFGGIASMPILSEQVVYSEEEMAAFRLADQVARLVFLKSLPGKLPIVQEDEQEVIFSVVEALWVGDLGMRIGRISAGKRCAEDQMSNLPELLMWIGSDTRISKHVQDLARHDLLNFNGSTKILKISEMDLPNEFQSFYHTLKIAESNDVASIRPIREEIQRIVQEENTRDEFSTRNHSRNGLSMRLFTFATSFPETEFSWRRNGPGQFCVVTNAPDAVLAGRLENRKRRIAILLEIFEDIPQSSFDIQESFFDAAVHIWTIEWFRGNEGNRPKERRKEDGFPSDDILLHWFRATPSFPSSIRNRASRLLGLEDVLIRESSITSTHPD